MSLLSSLDGGSATLLICSNTRCVSDEENDYLTCKECKRRVHYRCSKLPAYQIQVIKSKRNYAYYCPNCVILPEELKDLVPIQQKPLISKSKEVDRLRREIKGCEALLKQNKENEETMKECIKSQNLELENLRKQLGAGSITKTLKYIEDKFEKELECLKECLLATTNESKLISYADKMRSNEPNKEDHIPKSECNALKEAINDVKREDIDKQRRSSNVIIHGIEEKAPGMDEKKWVENLCGDLHVRVQVKRISRIGTVGKKRPLMVVLKNENEKIKIISNLRIKGLEQYRGIRITEDLTPEERNVIKELSEEAKTKVHLDIHGE